MVSSDSSRYAYTHIQNTMHCKQAVAWQHSRTCLLSKSFKFILNCLTCSPTTLFCVDLLSPNKGGEQGGGINQEICVSISNSNSG